MAAATTGASDAYCISLSDVQEAAVRIEGLASRTPVLTSTSLDILCSGSHTIMPKPLLSQPRLPPISEGHNLDASRPRRSMRCMFFKCEALQRTGSFKFRGALNATLRLREDILSEDADTDIIQVVTHSSGNHAQAVALAAKISTNIDEGGGPAVHATICMPKNAPAVKRRAVHGFGGEIITTESTNEAREEMADRVIEERGAFFIHPSEDPRVIAGQGTASLELIEQVRGILKERAQRDQATSFETLTSQIPTFEKPLDAVIIPVGGGGLAAGNTVALRGLLGDDVKIILAEPKELDDAKRSRESGKLLGHAEDNQLASVADGLKTTLGPNTWPVVRDLVDDIITVSEEDILKATKIVWERLKVCIEPSAGVGVAVAMGKEFAQKYRVEDGIVNVGVILCGGNVDIIKTAALMDKFGL